MSDRKRPYRIGLDFDGVLHSYTSGFTGIEPKDPPVKGAVKFVCKLKDAGFEVFVFTARLAGENWSAAHEMAIRAWLVENNFPCLQITGEKWHADLYIDDRGYRFTGDFTELESKLFKKSGILMSWVDKGTPTEYDPTP